jgi:hypothetical protein
LFLRSPDRKLIGRWDLPKQPFATLDDARDTADWLEMTGGTRQKADRPGRN